MKRSLLLIVTLSSFAGEPSPAPADHRAANANEPIVLTGELRRGNHGVGFRRETLTIRRPEESSDLPSAVRLYVWYPSSSRTAGNSMSFADYYRAQEEETPNVEQLRQWLLDDMTSPPGVPTDKLDSVLAARMWATRDAPEASGPWPLVLWSYRDSVPTMQTLLNEYLASHGYVVVFAWPVDHAPPFPWEEGLTAAGKRLALDVQLFVLDAVLNDLISRPLINGDQASVLSWSYGGESAHALQRRRDELRLAIGVDATLVSGWVYGSTEELAATDWSTTSAPYVLLRNGRPYIGADPSAAATPLSAIRAGSWFLRFPQLSHGNFNFPGGMIPGVLGLEEVSRWAVGGDDAKLGYEMICRHVLALLDHHLLGPGGETPIDFPATRSGFVEIERHSPLTR